GIDHLLKKNEVDLLRGQASFLDDKRVKVGSTIIEAKNIIIATGSNENVLKIEGHDLKGVITSTEALDLKDIPETLLVIGGGVIGLEFASIFKSFGSQVHIIEYQDSLLPMFDKDCGSEMERICEEKDIRVSTSAKVTSIKESIEGKNIVTYEKDGKVLSSIGDKVLMATGRRANTQGLGLEKTRVMVDEKNGNILVDENRKTTVDHIFAIGDVSNRLKLAHLASNEAILAVDYILGDERSLLDKEIPSVVYTRPEIASIGYREEELKEKNISYKKSIFDFAANGKAMTMGENRGFIKLLAGEDDEILGCVIIGPDASNLIASLSLAIKNKLRAKDIMHTVFAHPTTSEVIHEAALDIHDRGIHQ
ncbi:MAG: NAD(P)/FAD-dependent oxidoreductase, partial [Anaerococcus sp.]|nr:NAD(P)/FAD-dependent oxidoreductase [Peptoniphilaceae bacterium]MDY3055688.1 NAD(P)/FAD-dependent oxidoreductase [Anaerococcus sp.]